ncbi:MAG: antibiotic biosynthesis monooxygenase [Candidatus Rokubacteria bacterium]|nr:antibiotic biosynthesis monooxygenase [Candidatus Rokubacteria bacterium]
MLGVLRFEADDDGEFFAAAKAALTLLAARPGFRSGRLARAYDEPTSWLLVTEWESVGAYRRAMGSYEVRAGATPLLSRARPEPSAYEPLAVAEPGGPVTVPSWDSDRAQP